MKLLLTLLLLALPVVVKAQFTFTTNTDGSLNVYQYTGPGGPVVIPDTTNDLPITSIGTSAFYDSYGLTSVTIGTNVTSIGMQAFYNGYSLTNVTIPDSATNIGMQAFTGCEILPAITVATNNPAYSSLNGVLFNENQTLLIQYPGGLRGSYQIPDSVTNIGDYAFMYANYLTRVTIPDSVTNIGYRAFYSCLGLSIVTIGNSVTSIGDNAFIYCPVLTNVYFAGNAPTIDSSVFYASASTFYYLPGTKGWATFNADSGFYPAVLWNPQAKTGNGSFGVQNNQFGFNITGTTNIPIVVEASTNLADGVWTPLQSCLVTNGSIYFSDPQWTNNPGRYYRISSP